MEWVGGMQWLSHLVEKKTNFHFGPRRMEPKLSGQTHREQISCDSQKSLNFVSGVGR